MPPRPPSPHVLVVDDEESIRTFAERVLRDGGYEVTVAESGAQALALIGDDPGRFDLFLIDVVMPHMTGHELAAHIRRINPDAKVLYFTGFSDRLFDAKLSLWVDEAFVEKPVTVRGLLEAASLLLFGHTRGPKRAP